MRCPVDNDVCGSSAVCPSLDDCEAEAREARFDHETTPETIEAINSQCYDLDELDAEEDD